MYDLHTFRTRVRELYHRAYPYDDGRHARLADLAAAVGLTRSELGKRLNGTSGAKLTVRDIRALVKTLVEWGTIATRREAEELLGLVGAASFSEAEWQSPPLAVLTSASLTDGASYDEPISPPPTGNLMLSPSSIIGREQELATASEYLNRTRLLTIVGPGGVGKTRLALELGWRLQGRYPDGVWLVELAALADSALVPQLVAATLGIRERAGEPLLTTVAAALHHCKLLLIFDNCEHLVQAVAELVGMLLRACSDLTILATSRERLRVGGEQLLWLTGLAYPRQAGSAPHLSRYPAVELFITRAKEVGAAPAQMSGVGATVAEIARRLDGLPLSIELAAARTAVMSVAEIAHHLDERFQILRNGPRTAPLRHQALYHTLDWSYELLTAPEKALFRVLGAFAGSFTIEAVCAVYRGERSEGDTINLLAHLIDCSLVVRDEVNNGKEQARLRLLETMREYAKSRLVEEHEAQAVYLRHAHYYLELAEQAGPKVIGENSVWQVELEREIDNLRAACSFALTHSNVEIALRFGIALHRFWGLTGRSQEGLNYLRAALACHGVVSGGLRATALDALGWLCWLTADPAAKSLFTEAASLWREAGDKQKLADTLHYLAMGSIYVGDYLAARESLQEKLALHHELGDRHGTAQALSSLAGIALIEGDSERSQALLEESLRMSVSLADRAPRARALSKLGDVAFVQRNLALAADHYRASLSLYRDMKSVGGMASLHSFLGRVQLAMGEAIDAEVSYRESLRLYQKLGNHLGVINCLDGLAGATTASGKLACAVQLASLVEASKANDPPNATSSFFPDHYPTALAQARCQMDEASFQRLREAGKQMSLEQAIQLVLEQSEP